MTRSLVWLAKDLQNLLQAQYLAQATFAQGPALVGLQKAAEVSAIAFDVAHPLLPEERNRAWGEGDLCRILESLVPVVEEPIGPAQRPVLRAWKTYLEQVKGVIRGHEH